MVASGYVHRRSNETPPKQSERIPPVRVCPELISSVNFIFVGATFVQKERARNTNLKGFIHAANFN